MNKELEEAIKRIKILLMDSCDCEECKKDKKAYKTVLKELERLQEENEKKLKANQEMWQQIVDDKDKEINWLKSVINGILHI